MVTENVNIAFRSSGIPSIKRSLDDLGVAANNATRGFFLLQRAIYTLGGFGLARALTTSLDALSSMENRLKLTTSSAYELQRVQSELFDIANRSRQSWEGVAEIYNRTALSAKALGIAQKDVLRFTESVSKAAAMSGATTQESQAALVQLGQAVASNRLGGDELRSILEQLPLVADYIAKYMTSLGKFGTVTRGNIRQLGKEGKITADIIIGAFTENASEIDKEFLKMNVTIGQAFQVARTNAMRMLDSFDDAYDISGKLASAVLLVATNLDLVAISAATAGAAMLASFGGRGIASVYTYIAGLRAVQIQQTAVLGRLVDIRQATVAKRAADAAEAASAAKSLALDAKRSDVQNRAEVNRAAANLARAKSSRVAILAEIAETEFVHKNEKARSLQTGRFVALEKSKTRLAQLTRNLSIAENAELALTNRLAAARASQAAAQVAAQNATNAAAGRATAANAALAAAQGRAAAAGAAQGSILARLSARFPLLTGMVRGLTGAVGILWAMMAANPLGAVLAVLTLLTIAFVRWGNEIKVTEDKAIGLRDAVVAAFQLIYESVVPAIQGVSDAVKGMAASVGIEIKNMSSFLLGVLGDMAMSLINTLSLPLRIVIATVAGINAAWELLPQGMGVAVTAMVNLFITGMETIINLAIQGVNKILGVFGKLGKLGEVIGLESALEIPEVALPRITNSYSAAGKSASDAFTESFESTAPENLARRAWDAIEDKARLNKLLRDVDQTLTDTAPASPTAPTDLGGAADKGKKGANQKTFAQLIAEMNQEIKLLQMTNKERTIAQALIKMEEELKRKLTTAELKLAAATIQNLEAAKLQSQIMEDLNGPREKAIEQMQALNALYEAGKISLDQYRMKMNEFQIAADEASGTLMGGFSAAIKASMQSTMEFGKAIGNEVVGAVGRASDAIVEFAKTGKLNIRELFLELFANLLKLAAQRMMLGLLGGLMGSPMGGMGFGSLLGFSTGGSILPTGPGSTDSQIVSFAKRPDERVDILTPAQQRSADSSGGVGGGGTTIVQGPPVNVAAVISGRDVAGAFEEEGDVTLFRMVAKNKSKFQALLGNK